MPGIDCSQDCGAPLAGRFESVTAAGSLQAAKNNVVPASAIIKTNLHISV